MNKLECKIDNWIIIKNKYLFLEYFGGSWGDEPNKNQSEGLVKVIRVNEFKMNSLTVEEKITTKRSLELNEKSRKLIRKNDLILEKSGGGEKTPVGRVVLIDREMNSPTINSNFTNLCRPKKFVDPRFLVYALNDSYNKGITTRNIKQTTGIQNLDVSNFMNEKIFLPPLREQKLISQYLDKKTEKIDSLIEKIEKKIELLNEQKTALINQYFTKGIDSNVEMKDSGIDWIGEIPFNWKRIKIKNIVSIKITDGPHETPKFEDFGVPFISAEGIVDNKINFNSKRGYINLETHKLYSKKCVPLRDDVLIVKSGSTTGKSAIVETDEIFNIWSPLCILRSNKDLILPKFLFYCVQSRFFLNQVETSWSYGTQPNIGMGVIENLTLLLPPKNEQQLIVDILNNKLRNSNFLIEKNETKKNLLYEYKQSLISSVVTGKIRITEDMI